MTEPTQLPTKVERLNLLTPWVDNFVAELSKCKAEKIPFPLEAVLLDQVPLRQADAEDAGFLGMVIFKRAVHLQLPLTVLAFLALVYMSDRPGSAVMYLTVLKHLHAAATLPDVPARVTLKQVMEVFPATPSAAMVERYWDAQKYHGVNLVDLMGPNDFLLTAEEAAAEAAKEA